MSNMCIYQQKKNNDERWKRQKHGQQQAQWKVEGSGSICKMIQIQIQIRQTRRHN